MARFVACVLLMVGKRPCRHAFGFRRRRSKHFRRLKCRSLMRLRYFVGFWGLCVLAPHDPSGVGHVRCFCPRSRQNDFLPSYSISTFPNVLVRSAGARTDRICFSAVYVHGGKLANITPDQRKSQVRRCLCIDRCRDVLHRNRPGMLAHGGPSGFAALSFTLCVRV